MNQQSISVSPDSVEHQQTYDGITFPLTLRLQTPGALLLNVTEWIETNRANLDELLRQHGAILFRGFPLASAEDFDAVIQAFDYPNFRYNESLSNAVRVVKTERVFTANEAPPNVNIFFHHEMAQTPVYPSKLFFFCEHPAQEGGATPICRSDILLDKLRARCPEFVKNCEEKGLRYMNVMPGQNDPESGMGRSWQSTFASDSRPAAEARMSKLGYHWEWLDNDCLRATTPVLQAVREITPGRKTFFNQLIAAFQGWKDSRNDPAKSISFGDGTPLDPADVAIASELADELCFDIPWQQGDVVLVDNFLVMHGRKTFVGTRKVLASLVAC